MCLPLCGVCGWGGGVLGRVLIVFFGGCFFFVCFLPFVFGGVFFCLIGFLFWWGVVVVSEFVFSLVFLFRHVWASLFVFCGCDFLF